MQQPGAPNQKKTHPKIFSTQTKNFILSLKKTIFQTEKLLASVWKNRLLNPLKNF